MIGSASMPSVPNPLSPKVDKPEPLLPNDELDEEQRITAWNFLCLLDLGFSISQCLAIIEIRPRVSWHDAECLLQQGCPHETAVDLLT